MNILPLSDLHFEFHLDNGDSFIKQLPSENIDIITLAGDIANLSQFPNIIKLFCNKYPEVIFVPGNHCFWGYHRQQSINIFKKLEKQFSNFHFLDNKIWEYKNQRFLGTTLWFKKVPNYLTAHWSDFFKIKKFSEWVYFQNNKSLNFLDKNLQKNDIVITHYLPSYKSVVEKYKNDITNCFFVCEVDELIEQREPKLWQHGHSHCSVDYYINKTRIINNPYGYYGYELNNEFKSNLFIEI